jgi:hypothetical protein
MQEYTIDGTQGGTVSSGEYAENCHPVLEVPCVASNIGRHFIDSGSLEKLLEDDHVM